MRGSSSAMRTCMGYRIPRQCARQRLEIELAHVAGFLDDLELVEQRAFDRFELGIDDLALGDMAGRRNDLVERQRLFGAHGVERLVLLRFAEPGQREGRAFAGARCRPLGRKHWDRPSGPGPAGPRPPGGPPAPSRAPASPPPAPGPWPAPCACGGRRDSRSRRASSAVTTRKRCGACMTINR